MRFTEFIRGVAQQGLYAQPPENLETWLSERLSAHQQLFTCECGKKGACGWAIARHAAEAVSQILDYR